MFGLEIVPERDSNKKPLAERKDERCVCVCLSVWSAHAAGSAR